MAAITGFSAVLEESRFKVGVRHVESNWKQSHLHLHGSMRLTAKDHEARAAAMEGALVLPDHALTTLVAGDRELERAYDITELGTANIWGMTWTYTRSHPR